MIVIPFVPGTFGSMVEYCVRNFTKEFEGTNTENPIQKDGSVHTFQKFNHPCIKETFLSALNSKDKILTPIYPMSDFTTREILEKVIESDNQIILLKVHDKKWSEINFLFRWYKIWEGLNNQSILLGDKEKINSHVVRWNSNYKTFEDMERWEIREFISLFYDGLLNEEIIMEKTDVFSITNKDIIDNTLESITRIIDHLKLTIHDHNGLEKFTTMWREKQQYVIDEYITIEKVVESITNQTNYKWNTISLFAEAIIQKKLRDNGWEIKCYGLNNFPTNSIKLKQLLEKN